jgi:hypothetical protein
MVGGKHLGRSIHALVLFKETAHVVGKRPVIGLSGGV